MTTSEERLGRQGIPPADLDDDRLLTELESIHRTRHDTFLHGTPEALVTHGERMQALEDEYLRRYPQREVWAERTAEGSGSTG
jgi:hypothetical protein